MNHELLKLTEVEKLVHLTESTIYRLCKSGHFPCGIRVGRRNVRWRREEIEAYLNSRPRATGKVGQSQTT